MEQWPRDGVPRNPRAWLVSVGRFKGIDALRRRGRDAVPFAAAARDYSERSADAEASDDETIQDDQLRLIFTCCHPLLPQDARIALALREVCGLTTEEIARAFLVAPQAMKRRISRAKERIRAERIPYEIPSRTELGKRLETVLQVVYLVYNEGYVATAGEVLVRRDLAEEALSLSPPPRGPSPRAGSDRPARTDSPARSRRTARTDANGDWSRSRSRTGRSGMGADQGGGRPRGPRSPSGRFGSSRSRPPLPAVHAVAPSVEATDWAQIVRLYDMLLEESASPVVELNRAIAVAMRDGPDGGLGPCRCPARPGRACGLPSRPGRARRPQSEAGAF